MSERKAKLNLIKLISECAAEGLTFRKSTSQTVYPTIARFTRIPQPAVTGNSRRNVCP
jgi:hypothetical protein